MRKKNYAIELDCVSKYYKKNKNKINVLNNVSINFEYGKLYTIYGKSGIGKTTLIKIIGTIIEPSRGKIIIDKEDISEFDFQAKARLRNKKIGFIFQDFDLIQNFSTLENVIIPILFSKEYNKKIFQNKAKEILKKLELDDRLNYYPTELSGGEQQRVAIARALINNPDIILADEPTGNLDKENATIIIKLLRKLADNGKCVIIVSHDDKIKEFSDKVYVMNDTTLEIAGDE